jgi:hypothetical protein
MTPQKVNNHIKNDLMDSERNEMLISKLKRMMRMIMKEDM